MSELERDFKRNSIPGLNDAWVLNPPDTCKKRRFVLKGHKCIDIVICAFKCYEQCQVYFDHEDKIKQRKRDKQRILLLEQQLKDKQNQPFERRR